MEHPTSSDTLTFRVTHKIFLVGLALKGLNAAFELVVGSLCLVVPFETLKAWVGGGSRWLEVFIPAGWATKLDGLVVSLSPAAVAFVAWYFLSHGVVKAFVIACLAWGQRWAYPLGIAVFVGFGVYQTWEYFRAGGAFYLVLDALDLALIVLTVLEWRHATR